MKTESCLFHVDNNPICGQEYGDWTGGYDCKLNNVIIIIINVCEYMVDRPCMHARK